MLLATVNLSHHQEAIDLPKKSVPPADISQYQIANDGRDVFPICVEKKFHDRDYISHIVRIWQMQLRLDTELLDPQRQLLSDLSEYRLSTVNGKRVIISTNDFCLEASPELVNLVLSSENNN